MLSAMQSRTERRRGNRNLCSRNSAREETNPLSIKGLSVWGRGFRIWGSRHQGKLAAQLEVEDIDLGLSVWGLGFGVKGLLGGAVKAFEKD